MSIVFLGTPAFAVPSLHALVDHDHSISAVYTQPDRPAGRGRQLTPSPVKLAAQELGIPIRQPPTLREPQTLADLAALNPRAIVAVAYGQILKQELLDIPPRGVVNVHPSLLPRHRGASPIPAAILAGDAETGVTIMLMDAGMDTGPVLSQRAIPIERSDDAASLSARLSHLSAALLADTLSGWLEGKIEPQPQDGSKATDCPLLRKEHGAIDWSLPAVDIWRRVRAYNPWPGAHTTLDGESVRIWEAWPLETEHAATPGTVVPLTPEQLDRLPPDVDRETFAVQTGGGLLAVLSVQRAGRRAMPPGDFIRGIRDLFGRRLGPPQ
jgi:methionyl-tRNA formyltransferase